MKKPVYLFLFLFIFFVISGRKKSESSAPNVIYVLADNLGFGEWVIFEN